VSGSASSAERSASVIHRTRCHCCDCGVLHDADLLEADGAVYLEVHCPRGKGRALVSSDAVTFRRVRERSALPAGSPPVARGVTWVNILEITRECNLACPICFAGSHPGAGGFLPVEEVRRTARALRAQGLLAVSLSGGEPTLHPQLEEIVRAVRAEGLDVTVLSNGLTLGEDPALARRLAASGVFWVHLQLDTLREEVCATIRGDRRVDLRLRALRNVREVGLRFGVNATVVRENLLEVGRLLRRATDEGPGLGTFTLLAAGRTGRFLLPKESTVTREDVIHSLVASGEVEGLTSEHFWPLPRFAPIALDVHPDCSVLLLLAVDRGVLRPLDEYVDLEGLYRRMREAGGSFNRPRAFVLFNLLLWRSLRLRRLPALARMVFGLLFKRGRSWVVAVSIEQFLDPVHQDEERIERCTSCNVQVGGARIPACLFQHADPRRAPVTRARQLASPPLPDPLPRSREGEGGVGT
jgi:molybdenum cofactor biosynthesis enzyme MoaA/phage FluMu protein Com